jgi:tetratricopeptide (TPR) repeat protein
VTTDDTDRFAAVLRSVAAAPSRPLPPNGVLVSRFALGTKLGEGSYGVVYEAEDLRDGGRVALKILRHAKAESLYRFKREFRALAGLLHPHLVALHELFADESGWFFTMELVRGENLLCHVKGRERAGQPLSLEAQERLRVSTRQLAEGLATLHDAGMVHRDVKPSNVLVSDEGRVVIVDFGLVSESPNSAEPAALGTPAYMAPEQARGEEVGPPADLYAVGVMLYELLAGQRPPPVPRPESMPDSLGEPPPPSRLAPGIPADLSELCMRLLQRDPRLRPTAADVARAVVRSEARAGRRPARSADPTRTRLAPIFVGRGQELAELRAAFAASGGDHAASVLVRGPSGVGKTSLLRTFVGQLHIDCPEALVLEGRCHEREAIPYKALDGVVDALSRHISGLAPDEIDTLVGSSGPALARTFPVLLRGRASALASAASQASKGDVGPNELRQRAFSALRIVLTRIAQRRPTVVAIDDLQWADDDGLRALAELLRPPHGAPLFFVGTMRESTGEPGDGRTRLGDALPDDVRVVSLGNLPADEARELASMLLRRAGVRDVDAVRIATEAEGHPFFIEELTCHVASGSTASHAKLDDAIGVRIAELDAESRQVAEIVATAVKPLAASVAATAAHIEASEFRRSIAVLGALGLVRVSSSPRAQGALEPYHDRIREAVQRGLDPQRMRVLHRALAQAFEESAFADAETLTVHWRGADETDRAAHFAAVAGDQARAILAFDRAAQWFEAALELTHAGAAVRRELLVKLGEALAFAGRGALAAARFEAAATLSAPDDALALRRRASEQLMRAGYLDQGMEASRIAAAAIGIRIPRTSAGALVRFLFYRTMVRLRGFAFRERDPRELSPGRLNQIDMCFSLFATLGMVEPLLGYALTMQGLLLALSAGDIERVAVGMASTIAMIPPGRTRERFVQATRLIVARAKNPMVGSLMDLNLGIALFLEGRFREAADQLQRALAMLDDPSGGRVYERVTTRQFLLQCWFFLGRFRQFRDAHSVWLRDARARGDAYHAGFLRSGIGHFVWLLEDRPDVAEEQIRSALEEWSPGRLHLQRVAAYLAQTNTKVYAGELEAAHSVASEGRERTRRSLHWKVARVLYEKSFARGATGLALVAKGSGPREKLLWEAEQDARAMEGMKIAWILPFARVLRAGVARCRGERTKAAQFLETAVGEFEAADMAAYAAAARARLAPLRGGDGAAAELEASMEWLRSEGARVPERIVEVLLPAPGAAAEDDG